MGDEDRLELAEANVLATGYSPDSPGFELCVRTEYNLLLKEKNDEH